MDVDNSKTEKPQFVPLTLTPTSGGEQYALNSETLIGREVECTISLDSPHVSRYHAKIIVTQESITIEDLNSSNGTFVNGKRITAKTEVAVGDEIKIDDIAFRLTTQESGKSAETVLVSRAVLAARDSIAAVTGKPARKAEEKNNIVQPVVEEPVEAEAEPAPEPKPLVSEVDEDSTRLLNTDQINRIASMNKRYEQIADKGAGPRLIAVTAPIRGKIYSLAGFDTDKNSWTIGRSKDLDICVSDPSVSRHHATLTKDQGRFSLSIEPETKPVLINGEPQDSVMLKHNDQLQIGHVEFIFRLNNQQSVTSTSLSLSESKIRGSTIPRNVLAYAITGGVIVLTVIATFLIALTL